MKRSGPGEGDLVRVRSEDELRAGMLVVGRNCVNCGRTHSHMLLRRRISTGCDHSEGALRVGCVVWDKAPRYHRDRGGWCIAKAIAEGRLYRLRDEATPQETIRHRHRERVE